jgi:ubiquitin carboxyl-terminal hydrolase 4/11/15
VNIYSNINNYNNNYNYNYNNFKNYNNFNNNNVNNYSNINNNYSYINNYNNNNNFNNYSNINNYNNNYYFNNYINKELNNNANLNKNFKKESILNKQSFIGLDNIGATCYMNASLQCMSNVYELTKFILKNNLNTINTNKKKLSLAYQEVIKNLWPKDNNNLNIKSYSPYNFKKTISEMNPLFEGIQANDSKDLILFLLETMHTELNQKKYNIKTNINQTQISIYDFNTAFNIFSTNYINNYNSIISNIFYGAECHTTKCFSCNAITYNIQCFNILIFPLEKVRLFKGYNKNQPVTISDCFECHRSPEVFSGENQIYCNNCNLNSNASTQNFFVYGPNVLIINLNRGKGIQFNVKLNYELYLDISNYVCNNNGPKKYELIGVVQHYGESSMNGHYVAFCKSKFDKNWYKYNDSIVQKVNYNEMYSSGIPYVLFYHKL